MGGEVTPERPATVDASRRSKLARLRERGIDPYPARYDRTCTIGKLRDRHDDLAPGGRTGETVRLAGRIRALRDHGGLIFCDLADQSGRVQLISERGGAAFDDVRALDLGDWVGVEGEVVASRAGELSVLLGAVELLSKSLRAIPRPPRSITDVEVRHRQRYLDLIVNEETRRIFDVRHAVIASIRRFLSERGFVEVETPVLEQNATGAAARPFETYHNALDLDMVLRISLELPLKRLVVGGFERIFELGRTFRNEGLSPRHNPEFTMLELYEAFADCAGMMDLTERMVAQAALDALGTTVVQVDGRPVDLAPPWRRATMAELIEEHCGHRMHPSTPVEEARRIAEAVGVHANPAWGAGALMAEVFEAVAEEKLVEPTMVCDYPREISPLAKSKPGDPDVVDRFELIVAGRELANAYSELNDPDEQRRRMEVQAEAKATGDEEASDVDEDYLRALEHGLPPCGGLGVGIDRLVMLIAGTPSIREVILFPTLRPLHRGIAQRRRARSRAGALPAAAELAGSGPDGSEPAAPVEPTEPTRKLAALPHPRAPRVLAWLTALGGLLAYLPLLPILSIAALSDDAVLEVDHRAAAAIGSIVLGLGLLAIARGLARRKRRAWQLAMALFPLCAVLLFLRMPDLVTPLFSLGMIAALWRYRAAFTAPPDPRSSLTLVRFIVAYLVLVGVYGAVVLVASAGDLKPGLSLGGILDTTYGGLLGFEGPYAYLNRFVHEFFEPSLLVLGVVGLAAALWLALRPRLVQSGPSAEDRERARELVRRYGDDTLAYFALRDDKLYFFSSDGRAVIPYAFVGGHALVSGDPIGAPDAIARAVEEFVTHCRERAWRFAFLAVREDALPMYRRLGMRGVYLGDEAVIPCSEFTLHGRAMRSVRTTVQRVKRDHRFELIRESDAAPALVDTLNEMTRRWRGDAVERGFTMALGLDVEGDDPQFLLAIAYDRRDEPVGYLRLVPIYGDRAGYSLDLMRREPDATNGVTEFLIALTALRLGELGFWRLSMNFAPWGRLLDEEARLGAVERGMRATAKALSPFFQVASLRTFSAKFAPDWLSRSIVIEDPAQFARVGLLYAGAEGFLDLPVIGPVLTPRAHEHKERH